VSGVVDVAPLNKLKERRNKMKDSIKEDVKNKLLKRINDVLEQDVKQRTNDPSILGSYDKKIRCTIHAFSEFLSALDIESSTKKE
jgi:hypothetical protein